MKYLLLMLSLTSFALAQPPTPSEELAKLMKGNERFVAGIYTHPDLSNEAKTKLVEKQTPFATVISCSDSRVPPELIFDCGLGELFIIRDAGNVIGPIELGSVEYSIVYLKVPLIIVMGHQNCGAVKGAMQDHGNVPELRDVFSLIDKGLKTCVPIDSDPLVNAICCNVQNNVNVLKKSKAIAPLIKKNQVKVVGAYYEIETGKVTLLPD